MSRRKYIVARRSINKIYEFSFAASNPYDDDSVKSWDQKLHLTLSEIFRERRLTSDQMKELLRGPSENHTGKSSIFELILQREPALGELLLVRSKLSLLWIAVLCCCQDSAELLVRSGADVNELCGSYRLFPLNYKSSLLHVLLHMYPSAWNERFIGLLIEHGADLEPRDSFHIPVLNLAITNGRVKAAEMLLEKGANVDAPRGTGATPLHDAALTGRAELLQLLMKYGADIHARDNDGQNVLRYLACAREELVEMARVFIEKGVSPREVVRSKRNQPIHVAASNGHNQLVNLYLDHGANVNARAFSAYGDSFPLYIAARECENPAMLLTLLKRGANIDVKNLLYGKTALLELVFNYRYESRNYQRTVEKIKILLSAGADMLAQDKDGSTLFNSILDESMRNPVVALIFKTLALRKACLQPSIAFKGEMIIEEKYPELRGHYRACVEELNRIKSTSFIKSGAFFELLTKCQCQIVELMRYREFVSKFRLFDLSAFPLYAEDIVEAFERAENYYRSVLDQEDVINGAVYNILPYVVTRKVAGYAVNCEVCELKKIVQASRET